VRTGRAEGWPHARHLSAAGKDGEARLRRDYLLGEGHTRYEGFEERLLEGVGMGIGRKGRGYEGGWRRVEY
jgi:hypothetical protein